MAGKLPGGRVNPRSFLLALLLPSLAAADPAADLDSGRRLFAVNCAGCHGPGGEGGRGPTLATDRLPRAPTREAIARIVRSGIAGTEMPRFNLRGEDVNALAAWVWHLGRLPAEKVAGDPWRGERLYRERGNCALCHQLHGQGGAIGPDLTDVGLRRGAAYLRTSLTDPGADIPKSFQAFRSDVNLRENFLWVTLTTLDGAEVTGVRVNEDTYTIQVRDFGNRIHSYFKSELAALRKDWGKSPMPSYAGVFSVSELDDLVAFLAAQKAVQ